MRYGVLAFTVAVLSGSLLHAQTQTKPADDPFAKWEKSISQFEAKMAESKPKPGGTLFIGSSSIRLWKLDESFPELNAVNHGFGGSEIADSIHFFDRAIVPLAPATIILYAGDNDMAHGKSAEVVHADFRKFVKLVHGKFPKTRIGFVAIKPSIKRWNLSSDMKDANDRIAKTCEANSKLTYIDIWTPMLGDDGKPMPDLFAKDGLHLNPKGYKMWTGVVNKAMFSESAE